MLAHLYIIILISVTVLLSCGKPRQVPKTQTPPDPPIEYQIKDKNEALSLLSYSDRRAFENWKSKAQKSCTIGSLFPEHTSEKNHTHWLDSNLMPSKDSSFVLENDDAIFLTTFQYFETKPKVTIHKLQSKDEVVYNFKFKVSENNCTVYLFEHIIYQTKMIEKINIEYQLPKLYNKPVQNRQPQSFKTFSDITITEYKDHESVENFGTIEHNLELSQIFNQPAPNSRETIAGILSIPSSYIHTDGKKEIPFQSLSIRSNALHSDLKDFLPITENETTPFLIHQNTGSQQPLLNSPNPELPLAFYWTFSWGKSKKEFQILASLHNESHIQSIITHPGQSRYFSGTLELSSITLLKPMNDKHNLFQICIERVLEAEKNYSQFFYFKDSRPNYFKLKKLCEAYLPRHQTFLNNHSVQWYLFNHFLPRKFETTSCSVDKLKTLPYTCYHMESSAQSEYLSVIGETFLGWDIALAELLTHYFQSSDFKYNVAHFKMLLQKFKSRHFVFKLKQNLYPLIEKLRKSKSSDEIKNEVIKKAIKSTVEKLFMYFEEKESISIYTEEKEYLEAILALPLELVDRACDLYFQNTELPINRFTSPMIEKNEALLQKWVNPKFIEKNLLLNTLYDQYKYQDFLQKLKHTSAFKRLMSSWDNLDTYENIQQLSDWTVALLSQVDMTQKPKHYSGGQLPPELKYILDYSFKNNWTQKDFLDFQNKVNHLSTITEEGVCESVPFLFQIDAYCLNRMLQYLE